MRQIRRDDNSFHFFSVLLFNFFHKGFYSCQVWQTTNSAKMYDTNWMDSNASHICYYYFHDLPHFCDLFNLSIFHHCKAFHISSFFMYHLIPFSLIFPEVIFFYIHYYYFAF